MNMRVFALLAAVLVTQAAGSRSALAQVQTTERAKAALSAGQVLPICDRALVAAMAGDDAKAVIDAAVKDLAPDERATVLSVCGVYLMGALAVVKHQAEAGAKALKANAGEQI